MGNLGQLFEELDKNSGKKTREQVLRAPLGYPGNKSKIAKSILEHLPQRERYVEPFGGTGAVLLAKEPCNLEVLNDRYMGIIAFYRCIQDDNKLEQLVKKLYYTVHAREEFIYCKETWSQDTLTDVERAAKWYYMMRYSFSQIGRAFARTTGPNGIVSGRIQKSLPEFLPLHERLKNVLIENQDWAQCMEDFDHENTVFYIDPPYVDTDKQVYKHSEVNYDDLIDMIFSCKGFVALSSYPNPFYDNRKWDEVWSFDRDSPIEGRCNQTKGGISELKENVSKETERLYIKYAN